MHTCSEDGMVVGSLLVVINHGDALITLDIDVEALIQIFLTYLVPYAVSTYASVEAIRSLGDQQGI
jgi:hypothetical protein